MPLKHIGKCTSNCMLSNNARGMRAIPRVVGCSGHNYSYGVHSWYRHKQKQKESKSHFFYVQLQTLMAQSCRFFLKQQIIVIALVWLLFIIIGIQPLGRSGQRPELSQSNGIALVRCILGKFLGVVCHCFPPRLDVPTFATRCLSDARDPSGGRWNCGRECCPVILPKWRLPRHLGIFYMPQIYGFTSPLKEGVLRIFSPLKIRGLRPCLNPRTWVLKASTLPLDHRSR